MSLRYINLVDFMNMQGVLRELPITYFPHQKPHTAESKSRSICSNIPSNFSTRVQRPLVAVLVAESRKHYGVETLKKKKEKKKQKD